jgi:hypothetical protein
MEQISPPPAASPLQSHPKKQAQGSPQLRKLQLHRKGGGRHPTNPNNSPHKRNNSTPRTGEGHAPQIESRRSKAIAAGQGGGGSRVLERVCVPPGVVSAAVDPEREEEREAEERGMRGQPLRRLPHPRPRVRPTPLHLLLPDYGSQISTASAAASLGLALPA